MPDRILEGDHVNGEGGKPGRSTCRRTLVLLASIAAIAGCERLRGTEPTKSTPPAKVSKTAKEDDLGTVTLTPEAEKRLGIETADVEEKRVEGARSYAGDVIVPPGRW